MFIYMYINNIKSRVIPYLNNIKDKRLIVWLTDLTCANHRNNLHNLHEAAKINLLQASWNARPCYPHKPPDLTKFSDLPNLTKFPAYINSQTLRSPYPHKLSLFHSLANPPSFWSSHSPETPDAPNHFVISNIWNHSRYFRVSEKCFSQGFSHDKQQNNISLYSRV
jgi:hypothetical protein